jgi:hypothetical protein
VFRKDTAQMRADALEQEIPMLRAAAQHTTDELGGEKFRMSFDGATYNKGSEAAQAWQQWAGAHASARPPRAGEGDLGVAGRIGGHDIWVVQRPGNLGDLSASPVELRLDDVPGVAVEITRATSLNPSVGMTQRLENQVRALPEEVTKREARLTAAWQEAVDARKALKMRMLINFPGAPTAGRNSARGGGAGPERLPEVASRHYEQRQEAGGMEL